MPWILHCTAVCVSVTVLTTTVIIRGDYSNGKLSHRNHTLWDLHCAQQGRAKVFECLGSCITMSNLL